MQYRLTVQRSHPKDLGVGTLEIDTAGNANFFAGINKKESWVLAMMIRVKIDYVNATGMMISGLEPVELDKTGFEKYRVQEWWLGYA